jgi:hypothetical protein
MKASRILMLLTAGLVLVSSIACSSAFSSQGQDGQDDKAQAYTLTKGELTNAVAEYASRNMGDLPSLVGMYSVSACPNCNILNINALLVSQGGILSTVPDGLYSGAGANNDNCDGGANGCLSNYHYVWLIDSYGNVYSKCMGSDCNSNGADAYQGVWP